MNTDSFTDQKPRQVTEADLESKWGCTGGKLRCYMCGYTFKLGDTWRWVYAASVGTINFMVCQRCDGEDVLVRWKAQVAELKTKFWWYNS